MTGPWEAANAALLAGRGLSDLPEEDARLLLTLLHTGTLVESADVATTRALDLERLARWRAFLAGTLSGTAAEEAAIGLLMLGHRVPASELRRVAPSARLAGAWAAWVEADGATAEPTDAPLVLEGLRVEPAAARDELRLVVTDPLPSHLVVQRLWVGRALVNVSLRRRAEGVTLQLANRRQVPLLVTVALPARFPHATVDDVDGLATPLRFELRERHDVVAYG